MDTIKFTLTNESATVVADGKTHSVRASAPNFAALREALLAGDWATARVHLTARGSVDAWAGGRFAPSEDGGALTYCGAAVPASFGRRVLAMVASGESPQPLFRFYERLQGNPSWRSVQQLWDFLHNVGIPLTPSGMIMAYKGVTNDYRDCRTRKFDNRPGNRHKMPRNQISDDPTVACHVGFHAGSYQYACGFGARVVVVLIDPADVVCIPEDESCQKMRMCEYVVVGHYGEPLPSTVTDEPEVPEVRAEGEEFGPLPTAAELLEMPMDELRRVAVQDLRIVGAAHIKGGKCALVQAILRVFAGNGERA